VLLSRGDSTRGTVPPSFFLVSFWFFFFFFFFRSPAVPFREIVQREYGGGGEEGEGEKQKRDKEKRQVAIIAKQQ